MRTRPRACTKPMPVLDTFVVAASNKLSCVFAGGAFREFVFVRDVLFFFTSVFLFVGVALADQNKPRARNARLRRRRANSSFNQSLAQARNSVFVWLPSALWRALHKDGHERGHIGSRVVLTN